MAQFKASETESQDARKLVYPDGTDPDIVAALARAGQQTLIATLAGNPACRGVTFDGSSQDTSRGYPRLWLYVAKNAVIPAEDYWYCDGGVIVGVKKTDSLMGYDDEQ